MYRYALFSILFLSIPFKTNAVEVNCTGKVLSVGFLPEYSGKVLAIDMSYRSNIWARTTDSSKADMTLSLLLAAMLSNKEVTMQLNTHGATECEAIEKWSTITIERLVVIN